MGRTLTSGPGYLWPPRQMDPGQQLARMMLANPTAFEGHFLAHEAAAGVYLDEGVRRALEDNQQQIAAAEQRQREREEREAAEARKATEADPRSLARQAQLADVSRPRHANARHIRRLNDLGQVCFTFKRTREPTSTRPLSDTRQHRPVLRVSDLM